MTYYLLYDTSLKEKPKQKFKGIREERGLYKTQDGKYINADVNAAVKIIKKSKHEFDYERVSKWVQTAPYKSNYKHNKKAIKTQ